MNITLSSLNCLPFHHESVLRKFGIITVADLLIPPPNDIARKTKLSTSDTQSIIDAVSVAVAPQPRSLRDLSSEKAFTTGDAGLDDLLSGGMRTRLICEISGEGASGKTQLAMQLALSVQLPVEQGGLNGSACYLTTTSSLATSRLQQLVETHPLLSGNGCCLEKIQTCSIPIPQALTFYLRETIPLMIRKASNGDRPIRLIIIDSLAGLYRTTEKMTSTLLFERSKSLQEVSSLLHNLALDHDLAVVVVNDVTDVFSNAIPIASNPGGKELIYKEQSRWFNRPFSSCWAEQKEAGLGLVWANQINARIFLSRTGRRKPFTDQEGDRRVSGEDDARGGKRQRTDAGAIHVQESHQSFTLTGTVTQPPTLIRRLDVVFSPFCASKSIDFIIVSEGFQTVQSLIPRVPLSTHLSSDVGTGTTEAEIRTKDELENALLDDMDDALLDMLLETEDVLPDM